MLGSPALGPGTAAGPGGLGAQPNATAPMTAQATLFRSAAVIAKLELDAEILAAEQRNDGLELVLGRARDPDLVALNAGGGLPESRVLDGLHDLLRGVGGNALGERDGPANRAAGGFDRLSDLEILHRHAPFDQTTTKHIEQCVHAKRVVGREPNFCFRSVELDDTVSALEVITLADLLEGL